MLLVAALPQRLIVTVPAVPIGIVHRTVVQTLLVVVLHQRLIVAGPVVPIGVAHWVIVQTVAAAVLHQRLIVAGPVVPIGVAQKAAAVVTTEAVDSYYILSARLFLNNTHHFFDNMLHMILGHTNV